MFYTLQTRDRSGILQHRTDADVSGWTVNVRRSIIIHSLAAARQLGTHLSKEETNPILVIEHDGEQLTYDARHRAVAAFLSGKEINVTNA